MPRAAASLPLAGAAFLALADTAIVALALPPILRELDTDVAGVAAVLAVYAVVLAVALLPAERARRSLGTRAVGLAGVALFAGGSLVCGIAGSLGLLLAARAVQALGGAVLLVTAHAVLVGDAADPHRGGAEPPRAARGAAPPAMGARLWGFAALLGTAAGPALGGALTQAFGWRSIFLIQGPAALAALPGCLSAERARQEPAPRPRPGGGRLAARAALVLVSGAVAAALFLVVLLLVAGWGIEPLAAALVVSVMPLAALVATRIPGPAPVRAALGAVLVAAGAGALGFLPDASVWWTVAPQVAVGAGMGLALPALAGELIPDRDGREAAGLLSLRHAGIALALVILAPIVQGELDTTLEDVRLRGAALILDARLDPQLKFSLAPQLAASVETENPREGLESVFRRARDQVDDEQLAAYRALRNRADDLLLAGVNEGFRAAFLVIAGLALMGALLLLPGAPGSALLAAALAAAAATGFALVAQRERPDPVRIADPCEDRDLPDTGGATGFLQDAALAAVDEIACQAGSSREELVLALVDDEAARDYEERYGIDPRSVLDIAEIVLPG